VRLLIVKVAKARAALAKEAKVVNSDKVVRVAKGDLRANSVKVAKVANSAKVVKVVKVVRVVKSVKVAKAANSVRVAKVVNSAKVVRVANSVKVAVVVNSVVVKIDSMTVMYPSMKRRRMPYPIRLLLRVLVKRRNIPTFRPLKLVARDVSSIANRALADPPMRPRKVVLVLATGVSPVRMNLKLRLTFKPSSQPVLKEPLPLKEQLPLKRIRRRREPKKPKKRIRRTRSLMRNFCPSTNTKSSKLRKTR
jgi:hypothetical protein